MQETQIPLIMCWNYFWWLFVLTRWSNWNLRRKQFAHPEYAVGIYCLRCLKDHTLQQCLQLTKVIQSIIFWSYFYDQMKPKSVFIVCFFCLPACKMNVLFVRSSLDKAFANITDLMDKQPWKKTKQIRVLSWNKCSLMSTGQLVDCRKKWKK